MRRREEERGRQNTREKEQKEKKILWHTRGKAA